MASVSYAVFPRTTLYCTLITLLRDPRVAATRLRICNAFASSAIWAKATVTKPISASYRQQELLSRLERLILRLLTSLHVFCMFFSVLVPIQI